MTRLGTNAAARLAWALWVAALAFLPAGPLWLAIDSTGADAVPFAAGLVCVQLGAASAGAVIASRLPRNAVGWIFLALGLGLGIALGSGAWASYGITTSHGPLPGDDVTAWSTRTPPIPTQRPAPTCASSPRHW